GRSSAATVAQAHGLAYFAEGVAGGVPGPLGALAEDHADGVRVAFVFHGALLNRLQLGADGIDYRLLAVETADACAAAALVDPVMGGLVGVHQMQLVHRTLVRIARIGTSHPCRIGGHAADLLVHLV